MLDALIKMTPEPPNYQLFPISFLCVRKVGLLVNFQNEKAEIKRMSKNVRVRLRQINILLIP